MWEPQFSRETSILPGIYSYSTKNNIGAPKGVQAALTHTDCVNRLLSKVVPPASSFPCPHWFERWVAWLENKCMRLFSFSSPIICPVLYEASTICTICVLLWTRIRCAYYWWRALCNTKFVSRTWCPDQNLIMDLSGWIESSWIEPFRRGCIVYLVWNMLLFRQYT